MSTTNPTPSPLKVFYSYAHEDESYREELEKSLKLLKRQGVIDGWHDRDITAGSEWANEISTHLEEAHVILLLISRDFIASDYCFDVEMKRAMEKHEAKEARVIPIIVRKVDDWESTPFSKLQAVPRDAKPIKSWSDTDEAWADVTRSIRLACQHMLAGLKNATPVKTAPAPANTATTEQGTNTATPPTPYTGPAVTRPRPPQPPKPGFKPEGQWQFTPVNVEKPNTIYLTFDSDNTCYGVLLNRSDTPYGRYEGLEGNWGFDPNSETLQVRCLRDRFHEFDLDVRFTNTQGSDAFSAETLEGAGYYVQRTSQVLPLPDYLQSKLAQKKDAPQSDGA